MAPRTRSSGAPPTGHQQLARETPKTPTSSKRSRPHDDSESEREAKRPHSEPRSLPLFQRNQSYVARNRARWQQKSHSVRAPRHVDRSETPMLAPTTVEQPGTPIKQSIEEEEKPEAPQTENKQSTFGWLLGLPGRLFSPAPVRTSQTPPAPAAGTDSSSSPAPSNRQLVRVPTPELEADSEPSLQSPSKPARGPRIIKRPRLNENTYQSPRVDAVEQEFITEQLTGSNKRKIASNSFTADLSDEEEDPPSKIDTAPATVVKPQTQAQIPLKSAFKSGFGTSPRKTLRINETPTRVGRVYSHYGPAGEYTGSTFADKSTNSFSTLDSSFKASTNDESSVPSDMRSVRHLALTPEARLNSLANSAGRSRNLFTSLDKSFIQPNSFQVPDDDDDDESAIDDSDHSMTTTSAPAAPRMSHAELPDSHLASDKSDSNQDPVTRRDSEEAALRKLREQAQKYKPKTSSRLSTVEEKSRSRSSSPPLSTTADDIINADASSTTGPYAQPYTWSQPPRPSYSTKDPHYQPRTFDDTRAGSDSLTDKQRRTARDQAADKWVEDNVKWPEPMTYVDAGLCSNYIDRIVRTEVDQAGKEKAAKILDQQFEEVLEWAYNAKAKGDECKLVWDNGRQELVW